MPGMMVLKRKRGQRIRIAIPGRSEPIWIQVVTNARDSLRIGIVADKDILIDREEVAIRKERDPRPQPT